jgi:hypothetical protein
MKDLPECHWRKEIRTPRLCLCACPAIRVPKPENLVSLNYCRLQCRFVDKPEAECPTPAPAKPRTKPCKHLGDSVRTELCPTCNGKVKVKVLECAIHGECTIAKPMGLACCLTCPAYEESTWPA